MTDYETPSFPPSFREAISRAERQVGYQKMKNSSDKVMHLLDMHLIHELCAIMAEVYMMSPDQKIRISGEWLEVRLVQQVFEEIKRDHVIQVLEDFSRLCCDIKNKKAYLRAMLYNSVFSLEASSRIEANNF